MTRRLVIRPERYDPRRPFTVPCKDAEADLWAVYRGSPNDNDLVAEFEDRDDAWAFVERRRAAQHTLPLPFGA